jgi:hypothetical protein
MSPAHTFKNLPDTSTGEQSVATAKDDATIVSTLETDTTAPKVTGEKTEDTLNYPSTDLISYYATREKNCLFWLWQ